MGNIEGNEAKGKIYGKIQEAVEFLNAIVKDVNEKGGMEKLPREEVKLLADDTFPEYIRYFDEIEKYASENLKDVSLVNALNEMRPVLKEVYYKACLVNKIIENGENESSSVRSAGIPDTYKVKYMVFGDDGPAHITCRLPKGSMSQKDVTVPHESIDYYFKRGEFINIIGVFYESDQTRTMGVAIQVDGKLKRDATCYGKGASASAMMSAGEE